MPGHLSSRSLLYFVFSHGNFYTPHDSGGVLWFHVGRPCVCSSVICLSVSILFPNDNLSKHQWIFTKLGMYNDIMEIWFGIVNDQISSKFDGVICPRHGHILFPEDNMRKCQGILTNLVLALILRACLGLLMSYLPTTQ